MSPGLVRGSTGTAGMTSSSGSSLPAEEHIDLAGREAGQCQIEVEIERAELGELELAGFRGPSRH